MTLLAFKIFVAEGVDVAIIEVGGDRVKVRQELTEARAVRSKTMLRWVEELVHVEEADKMLAYHLFKDLADL